MYFGPSKIVQDQPTSEIDPISFGIDVETEKKTYEMIIEVGVLVLDPRDLNCLPLENNAAAWWEKISTRHFWIKETAWWIDRIWVSGCPRNFDFGTTTGTTLDTVLDDICKKRDKPNSGRSPYRFPSGTT